METRSRAEILNREVSLTYPWEVSEGVKFSYKFSTTPKPGTNALLDIDFLATYPNLQKAIKLVNDMNKVYKCGPTRKGFVYYFGWPNTNENIYATLNLTFTCYKKTVSLLLVRIFQCIDY